MRRPTPHLFALADVPAAVGLAARSSSEPAIDESTGGESATAAQGPTEFEPPADAEEAVQQATQHASEALAAISGASSGDDVDFRAYLGGAMLEGFAVPDGSGSPAPEPTATVAAASVLEPADVVPLHRGVRRRSRPLAAVLGGPRIVGMQRVTRLVDRASKEGERRA